MRYLRMVVALICLEISKDVQSNTIVYQGHKNCVKGKIL